MVGRRNPKLIFLRGTSFMLRMYNQAILHLFAPYSNYLCNNR
ncbi:hypothetical protein SLEP1_g31446 [Rubroshorea leprosula]|uniref:Uncharacterized protein n=1 Tax=Rubroshorea leprosula TaxID=152421 RepID=A0AAV5KAH9_9ROSI|nr:hypothetical protein SLEP1_g31446 [Rubroshorea leprosula]